MLFTQENLVLLSNLNSVGIGGQGGAGGVGPGVGVVSHKCGPWSSTVYCIQIAPSALVVDAGGFAVEMK